MTQATTSTPQMDGAQARSALDHKLQRALDARRRVGTLRTLQPESRECTDFYSNDYLGFARSTELQQRVEQRKAELAAAAQAHALPLGSTGSRLISGNSHYFMQVEHDLAAFYNSEAALLFNSGYAANVGVLSSVPQPHDIVLFDALVHNSCHEGLRLSRAFATGGVQSFQHNDVLDLETKLAAAAVTATNRSVFVVVESLYSMDGDVAPLIALTALCRRYNAFLIVDEAHGTGVYGPHGAGVVSALTLDSDVCCRVMTFGKAMGGHGAVVCGSQVLIDYLVNYARSFIYTTAMPLDQLVGVHVAHEFCASAAADALRQRVLALVGRFKRRVATSQSIPAAALLPSDSPIQGVVFPGNHNVLHAAIELQNEGVRVIPIRSPTVPKGSERFRIVIHAHNNDQEVDALVDALDRVFQARQQQQAADRVIVASARL